jgi:penicillin G amidase
MKSVKRILIALATILAIVIILVLLFISSARNGAKPVYDGTILLNGLDEKVTVFFDGRGMPHIYANTEKDLYFATGFLMARERMWQMDLIRRATRGTLSEIFGEDFVETDLFLRSLCMTDKSKMVLANSEPEILLALQYYCDGVNRYISDAGRRLPPEFRVLRYRPDPWSPEDVANIIGYMGWDLASGSLSEDIFNYRLAKMLGAENASHIIPDWKATESYVFPGFTLDEKLLNEANAYVSSVEKLKGLGIASFSGSNNWAVSGSRTNTGKPLLSNDMHLDLNSPGIWMQLHQVVPGKLNVTGVAVPGQGSVISGHNEKIAWGMTNLMVDDVDLFLEVIDTAKGTYLFNGNWMEMEKREELIKIKGGGEETRTLWFTHRGPIISGMRGIDDVALSMRWSGYDLSDELYTVYKLNRASSWDDFRNAISKFRSISQNFVYADTEGNIGLHTGGGIPVRKGHGTIIRDGSTDEYDWLGYVPFEHLPYSYNPPEGFVASANNKTVSDDYPYYIATSFAMPYRINRIRYMLAEKEIMGIDDFKRMITDQRSDYAAILVPPLLNSFEKIILADENEVKALALLKEWNNVMSADDEAPAVFEYFRTALARELLADELGDLYGSLPGAYRDYYIYRIIMTGPDKWVDNSTTAEIESLDDIIRLAFSKAVSNMTAETEKRGLSGWKWGDLHTMTLEHPMGSVSLINRLFKLNSPEYRVGGSYHTVSPYTYTTGFRVNNGASQRHIYNTADWDESYSIIPSGNSGVPSSPYYLSQTEWYVEGKFYRDHFTEKAVRENSVHSLVMAPAR